MGSEIKTITLEMQQQEKAQEIIAKGELIDLSISKGFSHLEQNKRTLTYGVTGTWGSVDSSHMPDARALIDAFNSDKHSRNTFNVVMRTLCGRAVDELGAKLTYEYYDQGAGKQLVADLPANTELPQDARKVILTFPQPS